MENSKGNKDIQEGMVKKWAMGFRVREVRSLLVVSGLGEEWQSLLSSCVLPLL